jgi:raffinose/stachyose/melibiose transport system permease protein
MILVKIKKTIVRAFLALLILTQVYPLLWLVLYSFKTNEEILSSSFFALPKIMKWENYANAFVNGHYLQYLWNSVIVTGISMIVTLVLGAMVSYAIGRFKWRGSKIVMLIFLIGIMIPTQATLIPLVVLFNKLHIMDTHISLILPYIAFSVPMAVFILSEFYKGIPHELEESAAMDGASIFRIFASIIFPITIPPLMTVSIVTFISIWNEYIMAATFISSAHLKTLPFGIYSFVGKYTTNYGAIGAYLILGVIPVLIVYFLLADKITSGMVAGAVKG